MPSFGHFEAVVPLQASMSPFCQMRLFSVSQPLRVTRGCLLPQNLAWGHLCWSHTLGHGRLTGAQDAQVGTAHGQNCQAWGCCPFMLCIFPGRLRSFRAGALCLDLRLSGDMLNLPPNAPGSRCAPRVGGQNLLFSLTGSGRCHPDSCDYGQNHLYLEGSCHPGPAPRRRFPQPSS